MIYRTREEIPAKYKWNIEKMYRGSSACEKDLKACLKMADDFGKYQGHLAESAKVLAAAIEDNCRLWEKAEKVFVYAHMKKDEDGRVSEFQALDGKAAMMAAQISQKTAFFSPELAAISEKKLRSFAKDELLKPYAHYIDQILREKPHVLKHEEEFLLAQLSELNGCPDDAFNMLNDADFKFGKVKDEKGKLVDLTHGTYIALMRSQKRSVRKEAYEAMYGVYSQYRNTLATLYNYNVKQDVIYSRIRKHSSSRAMALNGGNIPEAVYDNLIAEVNNNLPALHEYIKLRKKVLGLKELKMYDIYVPMLPQVEKKITYEEGQALALKALDVLGPDYINKLKKGFASGWADVYENEGKHSGAYSFGSYG
ncbi:MAG: oligoendopeptidase F family protein, partial [Firmicutes bacterium]|nr:oligoendopeptidase F family protein [Bacillota bacterium]